MQQKVGSASVYHDLERDIYYLIDKQTGRLQRSHKNGSLLKSFKLDISGSDYRKRREQERSSYRKEIKKVFDRKLQPAQVASEKFFSPFVQLNHHKEIEQPIRARSNMNSERLKSHESEANFLTSLNHNSESTSEMNRYNHITSVLKHFSKIKEEKVHENHCSLDKPSGTIINRIMTNSRGFRETKNTIYQPVPLKKTKIQHLARVASQQSDESKVFWGRQLSKQKKLFLQFHPNFEERENSRLLNEQIDRKKNIKKLEALFLEQSAKQTDKIYS